jgi:hypothetical protein
VPRIGLTGGAYVARSLIASAQRQVNLYTEPMSEKQEEPSASALYPTAGLRLLLTLPQGPIRGARQCTNGSVYVVAGSGVYYIAPDASFTHLGNITAGKRTPVSFSDNGNTAVLVDGTPNGWQIDLASNTFGTLGGATDDPDGMFSGADRVDYLDTFFIFNKPGTPQFYISGSLAVTFDSLDFANKESYSDLLVAPIVSRRELWLIGSQTTEVWWDTGGTFSTTDFTGVATSFQFTQIPGAFIDRGAVAKYSPAESDDVVYWLTADRSGTGTVLAGSGYKAQRISTFAMEAEFATYPRLDDAIGFCTLIGGHRFYTLSFPTADRTWVYDITTSLWHESVWLDTNGQEHRHRANCAFTAYGMVCCGDWENGNIYAYDLSVFTDNGQPIKRLRHFPHTLKDGKRVFYRQVLLDVETGTGGNQLPEDPQVFLAWSDDRGHLFGSPVGQTIGASGEYLTSVQFQRLGMGRDRVFQVQWSTPYKTALQGAWVDVAVAQS